MAAWALVVEDADSIRELIGFHLGRAGFETTLVGSATEARAQWARRRPDVVVLDLMLPDASGWDLCRELRASGGGARTAIIMLTALDEEADRITGLELGADDYVTKPFSPRELVARVRAVLRRSGAPRGPEAEVLQVGPLTVDRRRVEASVGGRPLPLTATEFKILAALAEAGGEVCTRNHLLDSVWGEGFFGDGRTVDVHIRHIREKVEAAGSPDLLETVRGFGYRLRAEGGPP
ncbi:MAG TPA: response regulator transcription factor [Bacillota bacterium]|nr:response regulator transcription factor [Bacillota bacterium]